MTLPSSSSSSLTSTPSGCLSGVLRRLLCHTLRHTTTNAATPPPPTNPPPPPPPGIVARLMGLDSMPVRPYAPPPPPEHPILRSRSTNSLDTWPVLTHKRTTSDPLVVLTKTPRSLSFREVPTYLRPENDDFLLLSFDPNDDGGLPPPPESVLGAQTASKERRKMGERRDCISVDNKVEDVEVEKSSVRRKRGDLRRRTKDGHDAKKKVEVECSSSSSSQDSSPISVLDHHWDVGAELSAATTTTDISVSEHKDTKRKPRDSVRRKLPPDLEDRRDTSLSIHCQRISEDEGKRGLEQEDKDPRAAERYCHEFSCRLAEGDVKTSSWVPQRIQEFDDVWEIAAEIGLELLESLLYEVMDVAEF